MDNNSATIVVKWGNAIKEFQEITFSEPCRKCESQLHQTLEGTRCGHERVRILIKMFLDDEWDPLLAESHFISNAPPH